MDSLTVTIPFIDLVAERTEYWNAHAHYINLILLTIIIIQNTMAFSMFTRTSFRTQRLHVELPVNENYKLHTNQIAHVSALVCHNFLHNTKAH